MTDLDREIAAVMEIDVDLLPLLPDLMDGVEALGCQPGAILKLLRPLDLPTGTRVLDLGCGKGAVTIALAETFGWHVNGVDAFPPFVFHARERAAALGLSRRCRFEQGDLRDRLSPARPYDLLVWASLGPMLGGIRETVRSLKRAVQPGGWIIVDDCVLKEYVSTPPPGFEHHLDLAATRAEMRAAGTVIIGEILVPDDDLRDYNRRINDVVWPRARELQRRYPEHAALLERYLEREKLECERLETCTTSCAWLLRVVESGD